LKGKNYN